MVAMQLQVRDTQSSHATEIAAIIHAKNLKTNPQTTSGACGFHEPLNPKPYGNTSLKLRNRGFGEPWRCRGFWRDLQKRSRAAEARNGECNQSAPSFSDQLQFSSQFAISLLTNPTSNGATASATGTTLWLLAWFWMT